MLCDARILLGMLVVMMVLLLLLAVVMSGGGDDDDDGDDDGGGGCDNDGYLRRARCSSSAASSRCSRSPAANRSSSDPGSSANYRAGMCRAPDRSTEASGTILAMTPMMWTRAWPAVMLIDDVL